MKLNSLLNLCFSGLELRGKTIGNADFHADLYVLDVSTHSIHSVSYQCQSIHSLTSDSHSNKESEIMIGTFI